ncbi:MAG: zinc ribbon domain-containing protein [Bacteroidetes bacterium]|nr:zinc ribbon domain-containing protein [Bacteroidota bacterium]
MPTYEYKCDKCGYVFEEFQSMNEKPLSVCPKCNGKVHRLIGAGAGLIFKGSGFYLTDYKKSNTSPATSNGDSKQDKSEKPKTEKPAPASKQEQPK